ncbi:Hypothetical protein TART1_1101 [Trichococcus shcherbakoviae]|uniref:Uncharacterized protein n=1 Tax=Trichococcus shcherbakoviae TaxID=2094020 RepID=A0A383TEN5_9LACT|nr:Hypothetical protein TART1_1101 [Trichococcus shcherbakoviae]
MEFLLLFLLLALLVRIPPNQDRFKSSGNKDASGHIFLKRRWILGAMGNVYRTRRCYSL